jgi:uroporphyrinogen-III synthase
MVQKPSTLKGKTIAITRPREQAEESGKSIRQMRGKPYFIPTIEIKGSHDLSNTKKFIEALLLGKADFVILMSVNGVRYMFSAAERLGLQKKLEQGLRKTTIVAVGPKTARELEDHQIPANLVPEKYTSEGIIQSLRQRFVKGKTIYIPRTSEAPPELAEKLREMGNHVEEIYVYTSQLPSDKRKSKKFLQDLLDGKIDAIIFSSSLGVKNFFKMMCQHGTIEKLRAFINQKLTVVAIGPTTAKTLAQMGLRVDVMPEKHLFEDALRALARHWNQPN